MIRSTEASSGDLVPEPDAGFSLIEVIVALLVFAIISVGIITATVTIIRMTADNRSREVAANLVAADMDAVRSIGDPLNIHNATTVTTVSGRTYTVTRSTSWQTSAGTDVSCGSANTLYLRRVNDTVHWTGQLPTTADVRSDTVIAPVGRISSAGTGAISVSVTGASGGGVAGVAVSVVPTTGGAALAAAPAPTDVDGCTFVSRVTPGTYRVTLSKAGSIDTGQASSTTLSAVVTAGQTRPVNYQYDAAAAISVASTPSTAVLPAGLATTFIPYGSATAAPCVTQGAATTALFPFASGYTAVAGALGSSNGTPTCGAVTAAAACNSVDPSLWSSGTVNGIALAAGARGAAAAPQPGGAATLQVPIGTVTVTGSTGKYLKAVQVTGSPTSDGNPGCQVATTYQFASPLTASTVVGLPFGSWTLYSGTSASSQTTPIPAASVTTSNAAGGGAATSNGVAVVTLDPRAKQ